MSDQQRSANLRTEPAEDLLAGSRIRTEDLLAGSSIKTGTRLQKVLSQAGVASRRAAEEMIAEGRVSVDGKVIREMGRRIDPAVAVVRVDGTRVELREDVVHLALNKPSGMLSTMADEHGRPCVGDLVASRDSRLFHVGRLDADTEGLLLLTNDGELGHRLMHPSFEVSKTYVAEVPGPIPRDLGRRMRDGVELSDGVVRVDSFRVIDIQGGRAMVELVLHEGRKHVVRRLLEEVGKPVKRLVRTAIADVRLGDQRPGAIRPLNRPELSSLYDAVGL
jgi:23S rRNA pseudouridine2605 synthase